MPQVALMSAIRDLERRYIMEWFLAGLVIGITIAGAPLGYFVYRLRRRILRHIREDFENKWSSA